jgi:hypothetical protein
MTQSFAIFDADGHVTESSEQVARYLDAPYKSRPLVFGLYPGRSARPTTRSCTRSS